MDGLSRILFGHAAFQYLHAACELGLFELLGENVGRTKGAIAAELRLEPRAADILLLGCTALRLLRKKGDLYMLGETVSTLMGAGQWKHIENTVFFEHYITYEGHADFVASLRSNTNVGLRRIPGTDTDLYRRLGENPHLSGVFYRYMRSWSELANQHLVANLDLTDTHRILDCGGGDAVNAIAVARANPQLKVTVFEIPACVTVAEQRIVEAELADRVSVVAGDMFTEPLPGGYDCILFAHQLVIWTLQQNTVLLRKAYQALPEGGRVVIFNSMSNDAGDGPLVAALDSAYFAAVPAEGGMIYSWRQHEECLREAGFARCERISFPGWTPHGIIIATK